ncbi:MAG: Lrp/AsnC family transcriptional regulator [Candidatus Hadarchaeales archaeon]
MAEKEEKIHIDEVDRKLILLLQANAKTPFVELGRKLGISSSGVHKRVRRLERAGVIKKYVAVVDPGALGKRLKAYVGISTAPGACATVTSELSTMEEVLEIHEMAGEHDLFVKIITGDTLKLNDLLHSIDAIPGVTSTKTEKETGGIWFS